jgi:polysaccharide export outer membrane protein
MPTLRPRLALPLAGLLIAAAALPSSSQSLSQRSAAAAPAAPATTAPSEADAPVRYRLGPGDRLKMSVFKMEGYETTAEVMSDGTLNLPRLGSVPVWGLTMDGARARITSGYAAILRRPIVYLDLLQARPVRHRRRGDPERRLAHLGGRCAEGGRHHRPRRPAAGDHPATHRRSGLAGAHGSVQLPAGARGGRPHRQPPPL